MKPQELQDALEALLDQTSIMEISTALVAVCHAKADHLRSNWQDEASAKAWERCAQALDRAGDTLQAVGSLSHGPILHPNVA